MLTVDGASLQGKRSENQDAYSHLRREVNGAVYHFLLVCDGLGGEYGGREASTHFTTVNFPQMVERLTALENPADPTAFREAMSGTFTDEYRVKMSGVLWPGRGYTTVIAAVYREGAGEVHTHNLGDSRAMVYRWSRHAKQYVSDITRSHGMGHYVGRCWPTTRVPDHAAFPFDPEKGDVLVLCSDGLEPLYELRGGAEPKSMKALVKTGTAEDWCNTAIQLGSTDNCTALIARK